MTRATGVRCGLALVLAIAGWWGMKALGLGWSDISPQHVRNRVLAFGAWAPAIYLLIFGQPVVPLPASIIMAGGGLAFGPVWGTLVALVGASVRACTQFSLARWLGRKRIERGFTGRLAVFHNAIPKDGFHAVLLVRLIPGVPFDLQNYGLGLSRVRLWPYALATVLGLIPSAFAFAYLGDSLTDPRQRWKLLTALLLIAGLVIAQRVWQMRGRRSSDAT